MRYPAYPDYVPTRWCSESSIPITWEARRLKFSVSLRNEKIDAEASSLEYMGLEHIESWTGKRIEDESANSESVATRFAKNDVLFGKLRPYLAKVYLAEQEGMATTEALVMMTGETLVPSFLKYALLSDKFIDSVSGTTYGVKMPRANWEMIGALPIFLPPTKEQVQIAAFLDWKTGQIDALIAKKQALIEKLKEKRLAVITQAVTKGLDPMVSKKNSNLSFFGEVPDHWAIGKLARGLERLEQGWSPSCEDRQATEDEWGVLKSGCVNGGNFRQDDNKTLPADLLPIKSLEVKPGDVLMCRASGSRHLIGSVAFVDECRQRLMFSDKTYRIRTEREVLDERFFVLAMRSKAMRDQIELSISGAEGLANNIPQSAVKSYVFAYPPLREQVAIVAYLNAMLARISAIENATSSVLEKLTEYRTALITAATTGEIDVRQIEVPVQA